MTAEDIHPSFNSRVLSGGGAGPFLAVRLNGEKRWDGEVIGCPDRAAHLSHGQCLTRGQDLLGQSGPTSREKLFLLIIVASSVQYPLRLNLYHISFRVSGRIQRFR